MIDVPETLHSQRERGRLTAQGRRSDDNTDHTPLIINEADGSWSIRGSDGCNWSSRTCPLHWTAVRPALTEALRLSGVEHREVTERCEALLHRVALWPASTSATSA